MSFISCPVERCPCHNRLLLTGFTSGSDRAAFGLCLQQTKSTKRSKKIHQRPRGIHYTSTAHPLHIHSTAPRASGQRSTETTRKGANSKERNHKTQLSRPPPPPAPCACASSCRRARSSSSSSSTAAPAARASAHARACARARARARACARVRASRASCPQTSRVSRCCSTFPPARRLLFAAVAVLEGRRSTAHHPGRSASQPSPAPPSAAQRGSAQLSRGGPLSRGAQKQSKQINKSSGETALVAGST